LLPDCRNEICLKLLTSWKNSSRTARALALLPSVGMVPCERMAA
jgi:hypothetical protein